MKKIYKAPASIIFLVFLLFPLLPIFSDEGKQIYTNPSEHVNPLTIAMLEDIIPITSGINPDDESGGKNPTDIKQSRQNCNYTIELWDTYGDGWNGAYLNVFIGDNLVLSGITVPDSTGPERFTFECVPGELVVLNYTPGQWPTENYYYVYDAFGNVVFEDGLGGTAPQGGSLTCECTGCEYTVDLYDDFGDGWNGGELDVLVNGFEMLSDLTILDGTGPESYTFLVNDGAIIKFDYTPGQWPYENSYIVYNNIGDVVFEDGTGGVDPAGGEITGECAGQGVSDLFLRIGDWINPEEWHNWIPANEETQVQLLAFDPNNDITMVNFLFSLDGINFMSFYTDDDGSQPFEDSFGSSSGEGDGWSGYLSAWQLQMDYDPLYFKAELTLNDGEVLEVENSTYYDFSPPSAIEMNVTDWMIIDGDSVCIDIDPGLCIDLDYVEVTLVAKADTFAKGIPPISQQPHSPTHCAPTAAASCLKYFEAQGDMQICGGLNDFQLVQALAGVSNTNNGHSGTYVSDLVNGLRNWIMSHGNNYTIRGPLPFDWRQMRNELEKCQDVLSGIYWPNDGGHRMAFNSIINRPDPETGLIRVDFMDPWTGDIEFGWLDPISGDVTGFTGAGPAGELGNIIIVCPKETVITPDTGTRLNGPNPPSQCLPLPPPTPRPALYFLNMQVVDQDGHKATFDLVMDFQPPATQVDELFLRIGDYVLAEEWHDWVPANEETHIQLLASDPENEILAVTFSYSPDGENWEIFSTDEDGTQPWENTFGTSANEGDGWSCSLPPGILPVDYDHLWCRAEILLSNGEVLEVENNKDYDHTPPSGIEMDVYDWMINYGDSVCIDVDPGLCIDLSYVEVNFVAKADTFAKGIPPISQQAHSSMHCAPTAAAACLKYFEAQGDNQICGGLNNFDLVQALAGVCNTSTTNGTGVSNLANGLRQWITGHGNGYTLRGPLPFDWRQMRNELEKCQDVLSGIYWPNDGGHRMAFNSIINRPDPETGLIRVDFMDPWTGDIEFGWLDPVSGDVTGFTGAGSAGELGNIIIVCPKETVITPDTGTRLNGPNPPSQCLPQPRPIPRPALYFLNMQVVDQDGHKATFDLVMDFQPPQINDLRLRVGDWLNPESWHAWIGGTDGMTEVQLLIGRQPGMDSISLVNFYYSLDDGDRVLFYQDDDGTEPEVSTEGCNNNGGDGWMAYLYHENLPAEGGVLTLSAEALTSWGDTSWAESTPIPYDPTPPDGVEMNIPDWYITEEDQIIFNVEPGSCSDLDYIWVKVEPKLDTFFKGIPLISQQPHSTTHCSPTAAAACLKYFESQGDVDICGGLSEFDLVDSLAALFRTNQGKSGTYLSDMAYGLLKWINNHGGGYTVRGPKAFNWIQMRNELERCQDVIPAIWWDEGECGHSMTFNSIINRPNADGTITVDFMDPWTGDIEWGNLNPATGHLSGFTGAGPSGTLNDVIYVCPEEDSITPGDGIIVPGPQWAIPITLPDIRLYFIHVITVDHSGHAASFDIVVDKLANCDWGDAPEGIEVMGYPTLAIHNGANHKIVTGVHLGGSVDAEPDGQPSPAAIKDDNKPSPNDEDGIQFLTSLVPGDIARIKVDASVDGYLNAWLDFDRNLDWAGEKIFADKALLAGPNILSFTVPASASVGTTFARFRYTTYNTYDSLSYKGPADDGEVIDHLIEIVTGEDKSKMHRPQLPDLTTDGMDVYCMEAESGKMVLADDFMCSETGLITDIHIFGSWLNDFVPWDDMPTFKFGIWSDNPNGQSGHSEPAEPLCEFSFSQDQYSMEIYAEVPDGEWFYWPHLNNAQFPGDKEVYKLNFYIPESEMCMQDSGSIYWLSVNVMANAGASYEFGWKSSRYHFNDFAVWQIDPPDWNMLCYPNGHRLVDSCMDMAFYISGQPPLTPEIRVKDCPADDGSVPSNINCPNFWASWDIWIDNDGDGVRDAPVVGAANNLYVRVRNDGPGIANNVSINLYYRNNTTGLTYPSDATPIGSITGLSVLPGDSASGLVSWTVPPPDSLGHFCIGSVVSAPYDMPVNTLPAWDNNVACVNIGYLYWRAGLPAKEEIEPILASFSMRNPFDIPELFNLEFEFEQPQGSIIVFLNSEGQPIDFPYTVLLGPQEEQLITIIVLPPPDVQHGDEVLVEVMQYVSEQNKQNGALIGGISYPIMVDLYPPEAIADLVVTEIRGGNLLSFTPATTDINGNLDHIACYNIYKWPDTLDRIGRAAVSADYPLPKFHWIDPDPDENPIYTVRVEDEAGYESANSNLGHIIGDDLDFGDAPDLWPHNYKTKLANDGARHLVDEITFMGDLIDREWDGDDSSINALLDDLTNLDDEDGVKFLTPFVTGEDATVNVTISVNDAFLNIWIDLDRNGDFEGANEHVVVESNDLAGSHNIIIPIPADASTGETFARFRYSTQPNLTWFGEASDGEVEDYKVFIHEDVEHKMHFPQFPKMHGWDVDFTVPNVLADDWMCSESGDVGNIEFWISLLGDMGAFELDGIIDKIYLSIHADIPASENPNGFSMPAEPPLWEQTFMEGDYTWEYYFEFPQGWYTPYEGIVQPDDHNYCFRINIDDIEDPFIQEEGTIYWLRISMLSKYPDQFFFGWKSSIEQWNDNAVYNYPFPGYPPDDWMELYHPYNDDEPMDLSFVISPAVVCPTVDAGNDATICPDKTYTLSGATATNYQSLAWGSGGDGTFNDPSLLNPVYTPGPNDITTGSAILCLTAYPIPPCPSGEIDCMTLAFAELQTIDIYEGWQGISSYLVPLHPDIDDMFEAMTLVNYLTIMFGPSGGMYWPSQIINTMGSWDSHSGYVLKSAGDIQLSICGEEEMDKTIVLNTAGWSRIPVLSRSNTDVVSLFSGINGFLIVQEVAKAKIYWPQLNINSIGNMKPGKAYNVYSSNGGSITYPTTADNLTYENPVEFVNTTPWNDVIYTMGSHLVAFNQDAIAGLEKGDIVGAFTTSGLCAGMVEYAGDEIGLVINGDDLYTSGKNGFDEDEFLTYKVYRSSSYQTFEMEVSYDPDFENSGHFHLKGISVITRLKLSATGINDPGKESIRIYPNPAEGIFTIEGLGSEAELSIFTSFGNEVYKKVINQEERIDLRTLPNGVYLVKVTDANNTYYDKLILKKL